ncbi:hypothetical protein A2U01_0076840, partial [Trifolium medium]|nr:hypothetical protein [Trifolium medium]
NGWKRDLKKNYLKQRNDHMKKQLKGQK